MKRERTIKTSGLILFHRNGTDKRDIKKFLARLALPRIRRVTLAIFNWILRIRKLAFTTERTDHEKLNYARRPAIGLFRKNRQVGRRKIYSNKSSLFGDTIEWKKTATLNSLKNYIYKRMVYLLLIQNFFPCTLKSAFLRRYKNAKSVQN